MGRNKYMFTLHAATNNMHNQEIKRYNRLKRMTDNHNKKMNPPLSEDEITKQKVYVVKITDDIINVSLLKESI
jgi:hypothetical protein